MGWIEVDNKHKKHIDSSFVSCQEQYERDYLKKIIKEEFFWFSDEKIENAIKHCCAFVPAPRPRTEFIECLKKQLGGT